MFLPSGDLACSEVRVRRLNFKTTKNVRLANCNMHQVMECECSNRIHSETIPKQFNQMTSLSNMKNASSSGHWTMADKKLFRVFLRILVRYLEISHLDNVRRNVLEAICECRNDYLQQRRTKKDLCLTAMLHDRLRSVVPEATWEQTQAYLDQYLLSRRIRRMGVFDGQPNALNGSQSAPVLDR